MPLTHPYLPEVLKVSVDLGFPPYHCTVNLHNGQLFVSDAISCNLLKPYQVTPSAETWRRFHQKITGRNIQVQKWLPRYEPATVSFTPKTQWEFEMVYRGRSIKSAGVECFPRSQGQ